MYLDPLHIRVLPTLANTGQYEHIQDSLNLPAIDIGHRHFDLEHGISYQISLTNTGEAILLTGAATATLASNCDRCLEPTSLIIHGEVQGYFLFDQPKANEDDVELELVNSDGQIDIAPNILAAIVVELPLVSLCRADCPGIAPATTILADDLPPEAMANLDAANPASPFAVLQNYHFEQ